MIVVAGGSGLLGRHVVSELRARGETVRVLVRDAASATALLGAGVEVVSGDVRSRDGLEEILGGARVVVSVFHGLLGPRGAGPVEVDEQGNANLVDAAAAVGAEVVLVSVLGAGPDSPVELCRAKFRAEQHLRSSMARWTIVRPPAFLETWLAILTKTAGQSGRPLVFGRGVQAIQFASVVDVATIVSRAATDTPLRGQVLELAGEPLTMIDLARALQDAHGWRGALRHVPRPVLRLLAVSARPFSPALARQNRMALAMDTGAFILNVPAADSLRLTLPALPDLVARFARDQ